MNASGYRSARVPFMCCEQARMLSSLPSNYFWRITRGRMRFAEAVHAMESMGAWNYIDLGPAGTLATFLKYLLPAKAASKAFGVLSPFGTDVKNLQAVISGTAN